MRLICSRDLLIGAITTVQKAVGTRVSMAILEGILFEATDSIKLTGYDMEIGIESTIPADIITQGQAVINARLLGDVVRKLPDDIVKIEMNDSYVLTIESGSSMFRLHGQSALDYPKIPVVEEAKVLRLPQRLFTGMIRQTAFSASSDDSRPVLNGINVILKNDVLTLVAVDGFRLAVREEKVESRSESVELIVPARALNDVSRILPDADGDVNLYYSHNHILIDGEQTRLVSRLIRGEFMRYHDLIPQTTETTIKIKRESLLKACERASLIIESESKRFPITFRLLNEECLEVTARTDVGATDETIPIEMKGRLLELDFNPRYFIEMLQVIPDETIEMNLTGPTGPCVVRPVEGNRFAYLVLPLRR
jgi:DNA polymerase-3 subunit beta